MGDAADRWRAAAEDPSRLVDEIQQLKAELAARDSKPVYNADAIRERLSQPFLGSEAETLGAKTYQLRGGEEWQRLCINRWNKCTSPCWYKASQYRLAKGD